MHGADGRSRVVIENVSPEIDGGRFPIKRVPGEPVTVEADIYTDGHDAVSAVLRSCEAGADQWHETAMQALVNDRWTGSFTVRNLGTACYAIVAWVDHFKSWSRDFAKRLAAEDDPTITEPQEIPLQREIGAGLIEAAAGHAPDDVASTLGSFAARLRDESETPDVALDPLLAELMFHYAERRFATVYAPSPPVAIPDVAESGEQLVDREDPAPPTSGTEMRSNPTSAERSLLADIRSGPGQEGGLPVTVDRTRARFSTWYELFPRSMSPEPGRHGTFKDVENFLPRLAEMGFDVVYLPPIHPIGRTFRKGPNNAAPPPGDPLYYYNQGEPGSPWAIGSEEGGHKAIHPELGTLEDFRSLVGAAQRLGMDIALDLAYQCSPDHPYVTEHPEWFRHRPDGTIQYAENPPKKYQDIFPIDFETENWQELWLELESVIRYWVDQGVRIFRVDNPHTKSFRFWEWTITRLKAEYPDLIFLSEAFTRPKVMYYLAKLGFTQSYTYYAWRNTRWELTEYLTELTRTEANEVFRPNFWPNTPDILTEFMQFGGRPAFMLRLVLAGTLTASYGIYGPAFELHENTPSAPGSEEYWHSEKYQIRQRDLEQPGTLKDFIARVNHIRQHNPALQSNDSITFLNTDNDQLIAYAKYTPSLDNIVVTVVNLDPQHIQAGWMDVPLDLFGIDEHQAYLMEDQLNEQSYLWHGWHNYVELNPHYSPAHIFRVRRRMRRETDFDYYA